MRIEYNNVFQQQYTMIIFYLSLDEELHCTDIPNYIIEILRSQ